MIKYLRKIDIVIPSIIILLLSSRILFYSLVDVSIFCLGFFFDVIIDLGIVFFLAFVFKSIKARKIAYAVLLVAYTIVYIADYMYFKSGINKIASITALYSAGFVDVGAYGVTINFNVILFVLFALVFIILSIIYHPQIENKKNKRNKFYLLLSFIMVIPYIYTFSIAAKQYDSYLDYLSSDTKTFNDLDRNYYSFMENFGYSVFRYEDVNRSVEVIIKTVSEAE